MGGFIKKIINKPKKIIKKVVKKTFTKIVKKEPAKEEVKVADEVKKVQQDSVNKVKGPTTVEMADATLLKNKRKGRRITNITAKKTLDKDFKLSKKSLLG